MARPTFSLLLNPGETRLDWAERFYRNIDPPGLLTRKIDGSLWLAPPGTFPLRIQNVEEFRGRSDSLYNYVKVFKFPDGTEREITTTLNYHDALTLFHSEAIRFLPELSVTLLEPAIYSRDGNLCLTPPGFTPESGIYYYVDSNNPPIEPISGTKHLETCFSGVPFERSEYRNNVIAWLLGAIFFDINMECPMLVITGNQRGIGKSKTMESCGMILTGQFPAPVDHTTDEFEKQLSARFREGGRFISFDNVVTGGRAYSNDRLSRMLTQGWSKKVRILGHSRTIEQKGVLFALNANDCKLDPDLASRSLPVKLYLEQSKPMVPFVRDYAYAHRRELYGELLTLALTVHASISSSNLYPQFRFRRWLDFVYPRIKKHFGPLAIEEAEQLDDAVMDFFSWGLDQEPDYTFNAKTLLSRMQSEYQKLSGLVARMSHITSTRARTRAATIFLKQHIDIPTAISSFQVTLHCCDPGDSNNSPMFKFSCQSSDSY